MTLVCGISIMKIAIIEDTAYWLQENGLYSADFIEDHVVENTTKLVDTFSIPLSDAFVLLDIIDVLLEDYEDD